MEVGVVDAAGVRSVTVALAGAEVDEIGDAERMHRIRALEELKCAAEAAQARLAVAFDVSQRAAAAARGVPRDRQGRGVAAQVALARRVSAHRGQRLLGLARIASAELPCAHAAWVAGRVTEWKVTLLARETSCLSRADRETIDRRLAADPAAFEAMGEGEVAARARALAAELDPASVARRRAQAEAERHTSLRPAPETMAWFSALLPVKDGVAVHAVLSREADRLTAAGDGRSRGQIMADTLVARVLGSTVAETTGGAASGSVPPVTVNLVVPDEVLLGDSAAGGWVAGYGPVPGDLLREWVAGTVESGAQVWVRRLYESPQGDLVGMDSKARLFPAGLAQFLRLRDQTCRTPWCDAPIRHLDHVEAAEEGGPTSSVNGQGLCAACNHAKQAHGWSARPRPGPHTPSGRHTVETTTPTGHTYVSTAPRVSGERVGYSPAEQRLRIDLAWVA